jgi:hypothetical protein
MTKTTACVMSTVHFFPPGGSVTSTPGESRTKRTAKIIKYEICIYILYIHQKL